MGIIIVPVRPILRKILGENEVKSLEGDLTAFIGEVYDDTVGDVLRSIAVSDNKKLMEMFTSK